MTRVSFLLALCVTLSGCGASALQLNATAATIAATALDEAGTAIVSTSRAEEDRAVAAATSREQAETAVQAVKARWAGVVAAHDLAAAAQRLYADAIVAVAAGLKPESALAALYAPLAAAWRSAVVALAGLGVSLPALPEAVQ